MLAALLALAASFLFGSSDFLAGCETKRHSVWSVAAVSQMAGVAVAGLLLVVRGQGLTQPGYMLVAFLGGIASATGLVLYYSALSTGTMNVVAPIAAAGVILPVLVGIGSGERASMLQYAGMALAVAGVILTSRAEARDGGSVRVRSVLFAVLAAAAFGFTLVALSIGGRADVYWSVFAVRLGGAAVILGYLGVRRQRLAVPARVVPALMAVGVLAAIGHVFFTAASTMGYLSIVSVLACLMPVVTGLYAVVLLRERPSRLQLSAAVMVLAGVVALSVS